ncbi:MAG: AI-2E family transporter [Patescibacteria group bacterium]
MSKPISEVQINISTKTILKIMFLVLLLFFLYNIIEIISVVFVAWVLASAVDPLVDKLQRYKIPRPLSILTFYIILILIIVLAFTLFIPAFSQEITTLTKDFPSYYDTILKNLDNFKNSGNQFGVINIVQAVLDSMGDALKKISTSLFGVATGVVSAAMSIFAVFVITFYMTIQEEGIKSFIQSITPAHYQPYIVKKLNRIQEKLGYWLWGQIVLMIFIGVLTAIALKIIGIKYILVLALFAGLCEFIPIIGPIIAAVPAVLFSLIDIGDSPVKPILVIVVYIVIQQIENQFLVPKIMQRAVGLNPIVVIVTILIGAKIGGIVGVIIAVPAASILSIFLEDFFESQKQEANKLEGEEYINEQIK